MITDLRQAGLPDFALQKQVKSWSFFLQARVQLYDQTGALIVDSGVPEFRQVLTFSSPTDANVQFLFRSETTLPGKSLNTDMEVIESGEHLDSLMILPFEQPLTNQEIVVYTTTFTTTADTRSAGIGVFMSIQPSFYGYNLGSVTGDHTLRSDQTVEQSILSDSGAVIGRLVLSAGPAYGREIVANAARSGLAAGIFAVILAAAAGWVISYRMTRPLLALTATTQKMAAGDLTARASPYGKDELGRLGMSFNEMANRVEETVTTLRRFVADAAHQVQTPLTALRTDLELARGEPYTDQRATYLDRALSQAQRMSDLAQSLLDLSRLEASPSERWHFQPVDLDQLIQDASEVYASRAEQKGQVFNIEISDSDSKIHGDPGLLRQAFGNLLDNAIKFTPSGGEIRVRISHLEGNPLVTIEDDGIGIPAEDLPDLFNRFHRGSNASGYPGSGLGLAIVHAIISLHRGEVWAKERSGGGTRISILFN
jgi:signal transduction histidine kinase